MVDISLTPAAAERVTLVAGRQGKPSRLRVQVDGGGCAGFQYRFALADTPSADDTEVMSNGVGLVIDSMSLPFVEGAVIDFVETLKGASFEIRNPLAHSSCSCGTSFSL